MTPEHEHDARRWPNVLFRTLGVLVVGVVGGVAMVFLVIGSILLIVAIFDPSGQGPRTDPMAGLTTFFYIVGWSFSIGAGLAIAAVFVMLRRRRRRNTDAMGNEAID